MAVTKMEVVLTAFIVATAVSLWAGAEAQSGCTNVLLGLSPCLSYITGNSSTPSSSCCSQLSSVIKSQPECLCQALRGGGASSLGLNINQTQAMALPGACNVQTPSTSCTGASGSTPPISPTGTQKSPTSPSSGTGTKTPITTVGESSSASSKKVSFTLFVAVIFLVYHHLSQHSGGGAII